MKISLLRPTLDAHDVKMVAVGLEQLGADEFVERGFFDGGEGTGERGRVRGWKVKTMYREYGRKREEGGERKRELCYCLLVL